MQAMLRVSSHNDPPGQSTIISTRLHSSGSKHLLIQPYSISANQLDDVVLEGPRGQRLVARALLDSGASMSLVSARAAQHLQLPRTNMHITFSGVQGTPAKATNVLVILQLSPYRLTNQLSRSLPPWCKTSPVITLSKEPQGSETYLTSDLCN